ncbi:DUF2628 domain-containing protein [Acidovorax sp. LjRoot129]|uniref:DUF2628 domain-containing protein n=1 Tax=Acidovorax sp. LjRoot129 TaxID=3342260 RepID=UPI003ED02C90
MSQHHTEHASPHPAISAAQATTVESAELSETWKKRFALIERAGGFKMPQLKELSFGERMTCTFNFVAALFGPFYYMAKGMWKRGLTYWGLAIAGIVLLELIISLAGFGHILSSMHYGGAWAGLFGVMANRDYYKKVMLHDNGWF